MEDILKSIPDAPEDVPLEYTPLELVPRGGEFVLDPSEELALDPNLPPDFGRFSDEVLRGIDIFLAGAPYKEAARAAGISAQTLSHAVNSPLGKAYVAEFYNQRKTWVNALYTRALMVQAEAMQDSRLSMRMRASENVLKHFGVVAEGTAAANASDVARKIVESFMTGVAKVVKDANIHVHPPAQPVIDITPEE